MRKWILIIHLYSGLLCAPYLIIFGISSLKFNHRVKSEDATKELTNQWEQSLPLVPITNDTLTATSVRDSLGMLGWTMPWEMQRDTNGNLHFGLARPGKRNQVHVFVNENKVRVEEHRQSVGAVINSLHGLSGVPNSQLASIWGGYTEFCFLTAIFAAASGVYFWATSKRERRAGVAVLGGAIAFSIAFIIYIVIRG